MTPVSKLQVNSISVKMICMIIGFLSILLMIGGVNYLSQEKIGSHLKAINASDIPVLSALSQLNLALMQRAVLFEQAFRNGYEVALGDDRAIVSFERGRANLFDLIAQTNELFDTSKILLNQYVAVRLKESPEVADKLLVELLLLEKELSLQNEYASKLFKLLRVGHLEKAKSYEQDIAKNHQALQSSLKSITQVLILSVSELVESAGKDESQALRNALLWLLFSFIFGSLMGVFVTRSITKPARQALLIAETITSGDYQIDIGEVKNDEMGLLLQAMQTMANTLAGQTESLKQNAAAALLENQHLSKGNQLAASLALLEKNMRGQESLAALLNAVLSVIGRQLNVLACCFYYYDQKLNKLELVAGYQMADDRELHQQINLGSGLIGQVAIDQQSVTLDNLSSESIKVASPMMSINSTSLLIEPLVYIGANALKQLKGVFEIALFEPLNQQQREFIQQALPLIGTNLNSLEDQLQINDLLSDATEQRLLVEAANAELEEQAFHLKASEEELKCSYEELEEKQQQLKRNNNELEQQHEALALQSAKLLSSKSLLEQKAQELTAASKYKSEFLANMSHELRTPLNSLLILSKSLADNKPGNLTAEQVEDASIVYQGGQTLLTLINDIMDLSKVEAGMLDINLNTLSAGDIRQNLLRLFTPLAEEKGLSFSITEKNLDLAVYSDRQRVEQILKNFLANAVKFTESGSIRLDIDSVGDDLGSDKAQSPQSICFSVTDTGIGIEKHQQREIFEAFKQADGSTSRKYGGTGLGLSISKQLAELLGGSISLSSKIAKGSIFTLTLPLIYQADSPQLQLASIQQSSKPQPQPQPFPAPEIAALAAVDVQSVATAAVNLWLKDDRGDLQESDKTLLLIEDDRAFSKILIDLIHKVNFKVITTDKGRDGILLAQQYLPAAILLDLGLPDINGLRVLEQLKQNLQTRHIPVHVISAADKKIQSQNLGAISYLQKPAQPEAITSTLIEIYANKQPLKKMVLVIEDDSDCAQQIKQLIAGRDTQLLFSESVEDACQQLDAGDFDCIILDLELSDMNATELVKTISEHARAKEVPIIIYTGQNFSDAQDRILHQFSDSIVIKGSESPERLLDDVTLFLHCLGNQYSDQQQQALQLLHDENEMLLDRRVLVVDDDMRNVFAITRILEQAGIQVTQAQNGAVAVELLSGLNPAIELILMDIMMPVMDGYQAMGLIREMPNYQTTPIIALTAKAMPEDRQKCIDAGACEYLSKPLDMDKVLAMLRVWLYR